MSETQTTATTAYNLVIVGGTAGAVSVAISSQRSNLGLVRIVTADNSLAFPAMVGQEQLDVGYGEAVTKIDCQGSDLVVTTTKRTYTTQAVMIAERPELSNWESTIPLPDDRTHIHVGEAPLLVEDLDVLVVGASDHAVEIAAELSDRGGRVVVAAGGMDLTRLSPAAEHMVKQLERERRVTMLYRSVPDAVGLVNGHPMAFFNDRRTPDLQFDEIVFAPHRDTLPPEALGLTSEALTSGRVWFQGYTEEEGKQISPGWRIGADIARSCFPEVHVPEPKPANVKLQQLPTAIDELRDEHYNATITKFEPTHSDLWVLRVKPDQREAAHLPGQYASLGLGFWEPRIDDAVDPGLDDRWDKLIRRSYSISSRMFDHHGYLADDTDGSELEFYIVLVHPSEDNVPALTPRLALKRPNDRIYLGPKVAGRYTLNHVTDPTTTVVFLSTGTGEAPHNAMVVELLRKGHTGPIVSAVSVRQWSDLGYLDKHRQLEERFPNYHYLPMPTREADVPKQYIQDVIANNEFASKFGVELDPATTHVFLCGNPAMIGLPEESSASNDGTEGSVVFPETTGAVELLTNQGFTLDRRKAPGNIHYEEYW